MTLDRALAAAGRGLYVFPCHHDGPKRKQPLTPRGVLDATTDLEQVATWWAENADAFVGVNCGQSGIVVLDVDQREADGDRRGKDGWSSIEAAGLDVPDTFHYATPSGGEHHWYRAPDGAQLGPTAPHHTPDGLVVDDVDRRAGNSYVCLYADPPEPGELAEPPAWLLTHSAAAESGTDAIAPSDWLAEQRARPVAPLVNAEQLVAGLEARDFGHHVMIAAVASLVRTGALGNNVLPYLDRLKAAWLRTPWDTDEHRADFGTALAGAVRKYGTRGPDLLGSERQEPMTDPENRKVSPNGAGEPIRATTLSSPPSEMGRLLDSSSSLSRRVVTTRADTVRAIRQRFAFAALVPLEVLTVVAGRAGEGKTSLVIHWLALATRGLLPGDFAGIPVTVAVSAIEDSKSVLKSKLVAADADLSRVVFLELANSVDGEDLEDRPRFPADLAAIEAALIEVDAKIWLIDPLTSAIAGDTNKRDDVRFAIDPAHALARRLSIAIIGIVHFGKGTGRAGDKISGSHALRDVARSVITVATDEESGDRIMSLDKSNYSSEAGTSRRFRLENTIVQGDDGEELHVPRVLELGHSDISVQDLINRSGDDTDREERNEAQAFVLDFLRGSEALEAEAGKVLKAGRANGFTEQQMKDARRRCKNPSIHSRKSAFGGAWVWSIDPEDFAQGVTVAPQDGEGVSARERATNAATSDTLPGLAPINPIWLPDRHDLEDAS